LRRPGIDPDLRPRGDPILHAVTAIRWGVLIFGLSVASAASAPTLPSALATSVLVFNASWRTIRPVATPTAMALGPVLRAVGPDLAVALAAAIATAGWTGPYGVAGLPAVLLASYIGGAGIVAVVLVIDLGTLVLFEVIIDATGPASPTTTIAVLLVVAVVGTAAGRETRAKANAQLSDMWLLNRLLTSMHQLTRSSNVSLDLDDVLGATRDRIWATFDLSALVIASYGVAGAGWRIVLADGELSGYVDREAVAHVAAVSVERGGMLLGEDPPPIFGASALCQPLLADDVVVGALLVEHEAAGRYDEHDLAALRSLAGPVALAIDNARWFRRIRTVAADEERVRIARELHDGVAQSLVAAHLDLGRIDGAPPEVARAQVQVEGALVSLRESLVDLRAGVTASTPLSTLAREAVARLEGRSNLRCTIEVIERGPNLPPRVEHEVWRILQEALANVAKHSKAEHAAVMWQLRESVAVLEVTDDGVGFDVGKTHHAEFGLRGMVERADAIGASLRIDSAPTMGTTLVLRLLR
jgi:signal transduction histidine kinase